VNPSRRRLDVLLVERGLSPSREQAQAAIMAGLVSVNGRRADKAGVSVAEDAVVQVKGPAHPYASRGGLKLEAALDAFQLVPTDWTVADIGASTGGFTDCWLQRGARRVFSVDVGRGQLVPRLAQDPRVTVLDRTNARRLTADDLGGAVLDGGSVDVSFIGLELVLPPLAALLRTGGSVVALVKPQFEVGPGQVGKGGIVRNPELHEAVLRRIATLGPTAGLGPEGVIPSPIRGQNGNREFLMWFVKGGEGRSLPISEAVHAAWAEEGAKP
jgi:23S rRNA (cytidine1920-2'-O)/16S rRNA (cytidine1409-2'-O)-methyltransferase